jgi:hypothetical protein
MSMKRLLLLALALALLLALASARPAAATYNGSASATMSCTDHTATMTRTVTITITWKKVDDYTGVAEADALAYQPSSTNAFGWDKVTILPPEASGTMSLSFAFSDTMPFGYVQWYLYNGGHIAPVKGGQLDAATFPGCPYP